MKKKILKKIINGKIKVCVIGLGYVGLPLINRFCKKQIETFGIDNDIKKIDLLKKGKNYIKTQNIKFFKKNKNHISTSYSLASKSDVIINPMFI